MLLIKTSIATLEAVLREAKHALHLRPQGLEFGDIILIAQTKDSLRRKQKAIRWIMNYVQIYKDVNDESDKIWGKHWPYIIEGDNVRSVEPFNIEDIQITNKHYGSAQAFSPINPEDESAILQWIGEEAITPIDERESIIEEFEGHNTLDYDELINKLDHKYAGTPQYSNKVVRQVQRPSALKEAILARDGATCKICNSVGFKKKNGKLYAETHHMIELNREAPNSLQSWNVLVVCPTCHKKLHYADVKTEFLNPGWRIEINGDEHILR